jgi:hypothetical protein
MSTLGPIARIASCVAVGCASGAVAGVLLAYLYETLDDAPSMIRLPGVAEVVAAIFFGVLGALMGGIIATINLGKLSAVVIGVVIAVAFVACWFSFVIAGPGQQDLALAAAVVPMMAVVGLLAAIVSQALQKTGQLPVEPR